MARVRRQVEQTRAETPSSFIICKFGFWRRGVLMLEWLTLLARAAFFPHKSQVRDIVSKLY